MTAGQSTWEKVTLFVFGAVCFFILLAVAWWDKYPTPTSWYIYNCVLAMAAGGISALLPGALDLNWHPAIRATSAFAIAVIVFYAGKDKIRPNPTVRDLKSFLVPESGANAYNPRDADVYVVVNSNIVKRDVVSSAPEFAVTGKNRSKDTDVARGPGGIRVDFKTLEQGDKIFVVLKENSLWWESDDMTIPEAELQMKKANRDGIVNRIYHAP